MPDKKNIEIDLKIDEKELIACLVEALKLQPSEISVVAINSREDIAKTRMIKVTLSVPSWMVIKEDL